MASYGDADKRQRWLLLCQSEWPCQTGFCELPAAKTLFMGTNFPSAITKDLSTLFTIVGNAHMFGGV